MLQLRLLRKVVFSTKKTVKLINACCFVSKINWSFYSPLYSFVCSHKMKWRYHLASVVTMVVKSGFWKLKNTKKSSPFAELVVYSHLKIDCKVCRVFCYFSTDAISLSKPQTSELQQCTDKTIILSLSLLSLTDCKRKTDYRLLELCHWGQL